MKKKVLGMIPARFASNRFPGKMLCPIMGKSLIQRTWENIAQMDLVDELVIATDDDRIVDHAVGFGAKVVMTSSSCINGTDRLAEALGSFSHFQPYHIVVNIQGDEPLIPKIAVASLIDTLLQTESAHMATAMIPITNTEDTLNPHIVKCVIDKLGFALYFSRACIPFVQKREFLAQYYRHLGVYAYRREFLQLLPSLEPTPLQMAEDLEQLKILEHGYRIKVALLDEGIISPHVDVPEDIAKVEQFLCRSNTFL